MIPETSAYSLFRSRLAILMAGVLLAAWVVCFYASSTWQVVWAVALQESLIQLGYWLACLSLGQFLLKRLGIPTATALGVASSAALGFGILGLVTLGLGLAGWLSTSVAYATLGAAVLPGAWNVIRSPASGGRTEWAAQLRSFLLTQSDGGWLWLPPAAAVGVSLVGATLMPGLLWRPDDPHPYDSLIYHLQVPREWFEIGRIVPLLHNVYSYFPFNVEIHHLLASYLRGGPWAAMYQAQFLSLSLTLLTALAIWGGVAARLGRRAAALAVLAFLTLPWITMLASVSYVESGMLLFAGLAILWLTEALRASQKAARLFALGGVFAGFACGVKLTNVPLLLVGLPLLVCLIPGWGEIAFSKRVRRLGVFTACGFLVLSPWLVRNAVWTGGNPVFPIATRQLGQAHYSDTQVERFERAHRASPAHAPWTARLYRVAGEILCNWRYNYLLLPLATVALILSWRSPQARLLFGMILVILLFWLTQTHLMGRFFILATIPAVLLIAMLTPRLHLAAGLVLALAAGFCFAGPTWSLPGHGAAKNIHALLQPSAEQGRLGLFGLQDYQAITDPQVSKLADSAREIVFVGDAAMFAKPLPMRQVRYSTIFDLNTEHRDWVDASYGPPMAKCPQSAAVVVSPSECHRLAMTYYAVPELALPSPDDYWRLLIR